jgi:hypothetical protein
MSAKHQVVAVVVLLGVFTSGVLLGGFGSVVLLRQFMPKHPPSLEMVRLREDPMIEKFSRQLTRELDLNETQQKAVRDELSKMGEQFHELHGRTRNQLREILETGAQAIGQHLTSEQKVGFKAFIAERRRMFDRDIRPERHKHGGPGGHHGNGSRWDTPPEPPSEEDN